MYFTVVEMSLMVGRPVQAEYVATLNVVIEKISGKLSGARGENCFDPVIHDYGVIRTSYLYSVFAWGNLATCH